MTEVLATARKRFTTRRLLGMVALFAISFALITTFGTGSWPIFLLGTAGTATFFARRSACLSTAPGWVRLSPALLGLGFFAFAVAT